MTRRFAEGTDVPVEKSRGEITGILATYGVKRMGWMAGPEGDELMFELEGRQFRFQIKQPTWADISDRYVYDKNEADRRRAVDAEWRRRWRANVLLLKAKLEFADDERSTVLRELLPYAVLADGRTLEEAVVAGDSGVPLLAARNE